MRTWCFMVSHVTMMVPSAWSVKCQYSTCIVGCAQPAETTSRKIAFTVTCDGKGDGELARNLSIDVEQGATGLVSGSVELERRQEAACSGEFYRRNNDWKFRFVAQGFNGGLKPL